MGICPRCGSWVDEGEPYCPECCYDGSSSGYESNSSSSLPDVIEVNGYEYDREDVEEALDILGYDLEDLESGFVDEDELEDVLDNL